MSSVLTMRSSQLKNVMRRAICAKRPLFVWGPPGIGKSDLVYAVADSFVGMKVLVVDLRLALMEPTDIRGFPFRNPVTNLMEFAAPAELPTAELAAQYDLVLLFLDELNSAPPSVQSAAYQLVLNRRIGEYKLPDNVAMLAAGNREGDRGNTFRMPAPLANRFRHAELEVNFEDWNEWALENNIHPDVIGYLSKNKSDLHQFDPKTASTAFATPRSWSFLSEALSIDGFSTAPSSEQRAEIAGCVGDGIAVMFAKHREVAAFLPDPEDVVDGKVHELCNEVSREISAKYSLVVSVAYELKLRHKNNPDDFKPAMNHACRFAFKNLQPEMVIMLLSTVMNTHKINFNIRDVMERDNLAIMAKDYAKFLRPD